MYLLLRLAPEERKVEGEGLEEVGEGVEKEEEEQLGEIEGESLCWVFVTLVVAANDDGVDFA